MRFTLHGDFSSTCIKEKAPTSSWRSAYKQKILVVEHAEPASGNHWRHVATAEAKECVRPKRRVSDQVRRVAIRINWLCRQENRIVGWKRESDDFIQTHASARKTAVHAANNSRGIGFIGALPQCCLFHGSANFAHSDKFGDIIDAAAQFLFGSSASGCENADGQSRHGGANELAHTWFC